MTPVGATLDPTPPFGPSGLPAARERSGSLSALPLRGPPVNEHVREILRNRQARQVDVALDERLTFRMDEVLLQARPDHWSRIWPAAIALSRCLLEEPLAAVPPFARELGCGMGLVSMTLAHLGVRTEATDRNLTALAFASRNALHNGLKGLSVRHLDWHDPHGEAARLTVAADVAYEGESPTLLYGLLHTAGLVAPGGTLMISGPRRRAILLEELVSMLRYCGYSHRESTRDVDWRGELHEISIHSLVRSR